MTGEPTREERDSMGAMQVPASAYYGAQTRRAALNFPISDLRLARPLIRALGLVKQSAALANADLGLLPHDLAAPIAEASAEVADGRLDDQFVVDVFQTGSGTSSNMNANEVIAGLANERLSGRRGGKAPIHPNDHVNLGQSSNDVFPTVLHVAALSAIDQSLLPNLRDLREALSRRAAACDAIVKIGRTHLQDAVPIRLGQELSGYAHQVQQSVGRVERSRPSLSELPIGGTAVGTGLNAHPDFGSRVAARLSDLTGSPFLVATNRFEAMAARDAAVEASGALRSVAVSLSIIANNLRWLSSGPRCGIAEIRLPELQPGSSIMPGKVNPVIPEAVMMVAAQVVGNDATIAWANALGSNFELNVMMPVIAHNLIQSIELLASVALILRTRCIESTPDVQVYGDTRSVEPDEARCRELVERSLAMVTALAPRLGYDLAAAIAKQASTSGQTVREILDRIIGLDPASYQDILGVPASPAALHDGPLSHEEVDRLLDPLSQTQPGGTVSGSGV